MSRVTNVEVTVAQMAHIASSRNRDYLFTFLGKKEKKQ